MVQVGSESVHVLLVHPSPLLYSEIYLRLEPLGLELVAEAARRAGHRVALLDLQVFGHRDFWRQVKARPDAIGFSLNYLANVPEVIDLARAARRLLPGVFIFVGGHSASFIAPELLEHAGGAIDCVVRGEGEGIVGQLLEAAAHDRRRIHELPGVESLWGTGPPPIRLPRIDEITPARDLSRRRRKYFLGMLDPCASIEFSRGCPWDCTFCSAWTFYGRSYRQADPARAAEELKRIREPGVFLVDDVAFIHADHGMALAEEVARRGIRKQYYLETRGDVLLRNREVFRRWRELGLQYLFLGLEAVDAEGLRRYRKRMELDRSFEALACARSLGLTVAVNLIADPAWDAERFAAVRQWAQSVPEIVHLTVNTPYPGTETWPREAARCVTRDYRLFDVQHAVLPTRLPLAQFYEELVRTQQVLARKHLGWRALCKTAWHAARLLLHGQTNFVRMLWKFHRVYNARRQLTDHQRPVPYELSLPASGQTGRSLYVLPPASSAR
jgi:hopanoid C-3 methylase HpnR